MSNFIIIVLLLVLIFKDRINLNFKKPKQEPINNEVAQRQKEYREQFDRLMEYSLENAIKSKKVDE